VTIEITRFRITQEFINNAIKHGKATRVTIKICTNKKKKNITAVLTDNGKGFEIKKRNEYKGMGLKNVNSRVEAHNGSVKIDSAPTKGTMYEIIIPC
jgi:two-component system NarL family sensor kinase